MKQISALLLLFWAASVSAQVTWFQPSDQWNFYIVSGWVGEGLEQIRVEKDTAIGAHTYRKLLRSAQFSIGAQSKDARFMRQDGQKVYALRETGLGVWDEYLLYDFSLKTGDTLWVYAAGVTAIGYVVTGTSSVNIGGQTRAKQQVKWLNSPNALSAQKATFIEGIGNTEGLHVIGGADCLSDSYLFLDEPAALPVDGAERTFCSFQSGTTVYEGLGNARCQTLPAPMPSEPTVRVFPSLSRGMLHFAVPDYAATFDVALLDLAGKPIFQTTLRNGETLTTAYKGAAWVVVQVAGLRETKQVVFF